MVEKNYINRVRESAEEFSRIYSELRADYEAKFKKAYHKKLHGDPDAAIKYEIADPWLFLFGAPIENIDRTSRASNLEGVTQASHGGDSVEARGLFLDDSMKRAVLHTVKSLKLHQKRLGGFATNDVGVTRALDHGKITLEQLEPLYRNSISAQLNNGDHFVSRPTVDGSDPFFWRALLEIFCRTYIAPSGRPGEWTMERKFSLAFDLVEIWQRHFKGQKWTRKKALEWIRKDFNEKYRKGASWNVSLGVVSEVAKWVEPMGQKSLAKLATRNPDLFMAELDVRQNRVTIKNAGDLMKVIEGSRRS